MWRLGGVFLPDGSAVEPHWIVDDRLTKVAPRGMFQCCPADSCYPVLVDAYAHVTVDYTGARGSTVERPDHCGVHA